MYVEVGGKEGKKEGRKEDRKGREDSTPDRICVITLMNF